MPEIVNGITVPTGDDAVDLPANLHAFAEDVGPAAAAAGAAAAVGYASGLDATKMKTVLDGSNAFTTGLSATYTRIVEAANVDTYVASLNATLPPGTPYTFMVRPFDIVEGVTA